MCSVPPCYWWPVIHSRLIPHRVGPSIYGQIQAINCTLTAGKWYLKAKLSLFIATISLPEDTIYFCGLCCLQVSCAQTSPGSLSHVLCPNLLRSLSSEGQTLSRKQMQAPCKTSFSFPVSLASNIKKPWCKQNQHLWKLSASMEERKKSHSVTIDISFPLHH